MKIEIEQETDGRWIADCTWVPGALAYGETVEAATVKALEIAQEATSRSTEARIKEAFAKLSTFPLNPDECNDEVFHKGETFILTHTVAQEDIDRWCQLVAQESRSKVDWHRSASRVVIKGLGNMEAIRCAARRLRWILVEAQRTERKRLGHDFEVRVADCQIVNGDDEN